MDRYWEPGRLELAVSGRGYAILISHGVELDQLSAFLVTNATETETTRVYTGGVGGLGYGG